MALMFYALKNTGKMYHKRLVTYSYMEQLFKFFWIALRWRSFPVFFFPSIRQNTGIINQNLLATHSFLEQLLKLFYVALCWRSLPVCFRLFHFIPPFGYLCLFLRLYTNIFFFLPTSQHILGQVTEQFEKHEGLHSFRGLDSNSERRCTTFDL